MKYASVLAILLASGPALACGPNVPPWAYCEPQQQQEVIPLRQYCYVVPSPGEPEINLFSKPKGQVIGQLAPGVTARIQVVRPPWAFVATLTPNGYLPAGWIWVRHADPNCVPAGRIEGGEPPLEPEAPLK
jgi:hypothetical protein